jgi:SUMO ligase MMS21 Smc5/6 complex component
MHETGNGKRDPSEFITDWNVLRHPEDKRDEIEAKEAWPRQYICPITGKAIQEPVRSPTTGYYYEQAALQRLLEATPGVTCPMTGKPFTAADDQLPVDPVMKQRIADFKERNN